MFAARHLRLIARILLVTFTSLTLQPVQAALRSSPPAQRPSGRADSTEGHYSRTLAALEDVVRELAPDAERPAGTAARTAAHPPVDTTQQVQKLRELAGRLRTLEDEAEAGFAQVEAELKARHLPAEILSRHRQTVKTYRQRQAEFTRHLNAVERAGSQPGRALDALARFLAQHPSHKQATPVDPQRLPFRSPEAKVRAPKETAAELQALIRSQALAAQPPLPAGEGRVRVKAPKVPTASTPAPATATTSAANNTAPTAEDLAETEDVRLTPAIQTQAAALHHNPVEIHTWVRNHIEFLPSYGSIQGSELTLQTQRGNAFDTASLEIALLRASSIPARYAYGTVQIPANQVMNWVGGVTTPEAAQSLLGQGGIPNVALVSGGKIVAFKLEHVWVDAYVDFVPSRGAKHKEGDTWVPLDASFKQYQYVQGMDIQSAVPFDAQDFLAKIQQGATFNDTEGWVQNLDQGKIQQALTDYQAQVKSYIDQHNPNATVGDVLGTKTIQAEKSTVLMGSLPYKVISAGVNFAAIPANLKWKLTFNLYVSELDKAMQMPQLSVPLALSQIGTKRIAVVYTPATSADEQVIAAYKGASQLPAYLVTQKLAVQLDDQVLAQYGAQGMGQEQYWTYTLAIPGRGDVEEDFKVSSAVGDQVVFGVDGNGLLDEQAVKRSQAVNPNAPLENLQQLSLGYWARADMSDTLLAQSMKAVFYRQPSVGMFAQPFSVVYSWGIPAFGSYKSYLLDIRRLSTSAVTLHEGSTQTFMIQSGMKNSYLEGRIFEEVFDESPGIGYSAVAVLSQAVNEGTPVWRIDNDNLSAYIRASTLSSTLKNQISDMTAAGMIVLAPQAMADAGFWSAEGYIAIDPSSGGGAYILQGANGGEFQDCVEQSEPLTKSISAQITTFIVLALVAAILAGITVGSGGAGAPVTASAFAMAMAAMGVTALTWSSTSYAAGKCDNKNCHRGRFQAQGADITDGKGQGNSKGKSESWAQPNPLSLSKALQLLDHLKLQLTPAQLDARVVYFSEAEANVRNAATGGGGCAPYFPPSFGPDPNIKQHVKNGIRVDIEVHAGKAFVP